MSSVEAFLTRELEIRFIDARELTNEARISLGLNGYPSRDEKRRIRAKALSLFESRPEEDRATMKRLSEALAAIKADSMSLTSEFDGGDSSEEFDARSSTIRSSHSNHLSAGHQNKKRRGPAAWFLGGRR